MFELHQHNVHMDNSCQLNEFWVLLLNDLDGCFCSLLEKNLSGVSEFFFAV